MTASHYRPRLSGLYVILDPTVRPNRPLVEVMNAAAAEGAGIFQYRNKTASMKDAFAEALPLRKRARDLGVLFLINDRCDLTLALDADGVHLGQNDLPIRSARLILGSEKYIGLSTHNERQVEAAETAKPDYIGFGPIFKPGSKPDHDPVVGIHGLRMIRPLTTLPVFAIGGIQTDQAAPVMEAGANGIAVISAIVAAPDIRLAVKEMISELTRVQSSRKAST
jgi:thiamine-phosphate pyrophosphorylase